MERILGLPAPLSTPRMCVCLESLDRILSTSVSQRAGMMLPERSYYPFIRGHEFLEKSLSQCFIYGRPHLWTATATGLQGPCDQNVGEDALAGRTCRVQEACALVAGI